MRPTKYEQYIWMYAYMPSLTQKAIQSELNLTDVEAMAAKTGSARRFPVFVKMLLAALRPGSSSGSGRSGAAAAAGGGSGGVFLDLLTYRDLVRPLTHQPPHTPSSPPLTTAKYQNHKTQELLKQRGRPQPAGAGSATASSAARVDKLYLILTHASEFERVRVRGFFFFFF